jgi:hypothetical protein
MRSCACARRLERLKRFFGCPEPHFEAGRAKARIPRDYWNLHRWNKENAHP